MYHTMYQPVHMKFPGPDPPSGPSKATPYFRPNSKSCSYVLYNVSTYPCELCHLRYGTLVASFPGLPQLFSIKAGDKAGDEASTLGLCSNKWSCLYDQHTCISVLPVYT